MCLREYWLCKIKSSCKAVLISLFSNGYMFKFSRSLSYCLDWHVAQDNTCAFFAFFEVYFKLCPKTEHNNLSLIVVFIVGCNDLG